MRAVCSGPPRGERRVSNFIGAPPSPGPHLIASWFPMRILFLGALALPSAAATANRARELENVVLIPYGAARLRITVFPWMPPPQ